MGRKRTKIHTPTPIGEKIAEYRKKNSYTMQQLAQKLGVTNSFVSRLESGERKPNRIMIYELVKIFFPNGNPTVLDEWLLLGGFSPLQPTTNHPSGQFKVFEQKLLENNRDEHMHLTFIRQLIKSNCHEWARQQMKKAYQTFENPVALQSLIGTQALLDGNIEQAISSQNMAIQLHQNMDDNTLPLEDLYLSLGVSYFSKGLAAFDEYNHLKLNNNNSQLESKKAEAIQQFKIAQQQFQYSLDYNPDDIYARDELARALFNVGELTNDTQYWNLAIIEFKKVLLNPAKHFLSPQALADTTIYLAHAYSKLKQFQEAEFMLALIDALKPSYWLVNYVKACFYSLRYEYDKNTEWLKESLVYLEKALEADNTQNRAIKQFNLDPDLRALRNYKSKEIDNMIGNLK